MIGGMIALCLLLYPELTKEGASIQAAIESMGTFTAAFGADRLNYAELMGFYGIYGGCMLGIGGIFYAAVLGTGMLEKEEREHTAEFLLTHPVSRSQVVTEKLLAMISQMLLLNGMVILLSVVSFCIIGEKPDWHDFFLFHGAQIVMQFEILCICFGISAFPEKRRYQRRDRYSSGTVFPGCIWKYHGKGRVCNLYYSIYLCGRGQCDPGRGIRHKAGYAGDGLCSDRPNCRLRKVYQKGYLLI